MPQTQDRGEIFLQAFMHAVIRARAHQVAIRTKTTITTVSPTGKGDPFGHDHVLIVPRTIAGQQPSPILSKTLPPPIRPPTTVQQKAPVAQAFTSPVPQKNTQPRQPQFIPRQTQPQAPRQPVPQTVQAVQPGSPTLIPLPSLAKLQPFLNDQRVNMVECPGPQKPVLVTQSGRVQATGVTLTTDEINAILKEVSEKTHIPLGSGLFKAALGNLIITAIISEYIGTRLILQKK